MTSSAVRGALERSLSCIPYDEPMGVSENEGTLFGVLIIRILLFRVLY